MLLGIPRNTHRYFIEPLSGTPHIMLSLFKRFLNFINWIKNSSKSILNNILDLIKNDCRAQSTKTVLVNRKTHIGELRSDDLKNMCFYDVPQGEKWKVRLAKEILGVKNKTLDIDNWNTASLDDIMAEILT